jgi:hypothetical protein
VRRPDVFHRRSRKDRVDSSLARALGPCKHSSTEVGSEDDDKAGDLVEIRTEDK